RMPLPRLTRQSVFGAAAVTGLLLLSLCLSAFAAVGPGTAPVTVPTGGFGIEGDLRANDPTAGIGDWVPGSAGSGSNVLTAAGVPLNTLTTFHVIDLYSSGLDDNFHGGDKVDDNPNTGWTWIQNPVGDKVDMNNGLVHFAVDSQNHQWVIVAGDRYKDS